MGRVRIRYLCISGLLFILGILAVLWLFQGSFLYTEDTLALTYSRSTSTFSSKERFYVRDNLLYYAEDRGEKTVVRYVKNNVVHTFAEIPPNYEHFIILDDGTLIVQIRDTLYSLDTENKYPVELWPGSCVGSFENQVYFIHNTTLYTAEITESEPRKVVLFDELLGSYNDGIVYRSGECIYQLLYEQSNIPLLVTSGEIPWSKDITSWALDVAYLYTSEYALRIGSHSLDMYIYKTGELQRIYEADVDNMIIMAVVAGKKELYVSRQLVDLKFYPLKDNKINGTYKYDIQAKSWTKISSEVCSMLVQFDKQSLYGCDSYGVYDKIKRLEVD